MKYLLVDASNTFFRARHVAARGADQWTKLGYAIHITLGSIHKAQRDLGGDHVVICLEGRSWRKDFYPPYKRNRSAARETMTAEESEEDKLFYETYDEMNKFFREKTACTVLRHPQGEADDMIARWIALHPDDEHIIISSDSDFHQLISERVTQFNGVTGEWTNLHGVFNDKMKPVKDKKTGEQKSIGDPKFVLFEKCMRGDPTDNVFSAYPGVRTKGTKNKVGLTEAYSDMGKKGYAWNNIMLQRWTDHDNVEHRVLDDYERNVKLIDLTAQPDDIKAAFDAEIKHLVNVEVPSQIGTQLLKFCGKYDLVKIAEQASYYSEWMKKEYRGALLNVKS
jgi:5'-3' exonuclease